MTFRDRLTMSSRRLRVRAGLGIVLAVAVGAVPVLPGLALSPADAYTKWQSGVYTGQCGQKGVDAVNAFSSWRHATVERTSAYVSSYSWSSIYALKGVGTCTKRTGLPTTLSVPMLPTKGSVSLKTGAKGTYNAYWTKFGKAAIANGYAKATIRLGWEMNGSWFRWSAAKDPTDWKKYWIQIVKTLRKVPGNHFTFEWSPGLGKNAMSDVSKAYPGDGYVTYIGSTVYDQLYGQPTATPTQIWKSLTTSPYSLNWLASFAKKHHKKVAIAEWGLASSSSFNNGGGGDDPYFISHFYAWMKKSNLIYDIYFNRVHNNTPPQPPNEHRLTLSAHTTNPTFKNAAAAYKKFFGGG
jgi:beta-mannanase